MTKRVTVEELAANLDAHLEEVKRGETLALLENGQEVAQIRRTEPELKIVRHDPALRLQDFKPAPRPKRLDFNAVDWLIDERERSGKKYGL